MNVSFNTLPRRFIQMVRPHTPLIKFRKGAVENTKKSNIEEQVNFTKQLFTRPVLEDFQLPLKYRRRPLDEAEINAINSGGVY